jgi:hypothetical protein
MERRLKRKKQEDKNNLSNRCEVVSARIAD